VTREGFAYRMEIYFWIFWLYWGADFVAIFSVWRAC